MMKLDSRALLVLLSFAAASHALSPTHFRDAWRTLKAPWTTTLTHTSSIRVLQVGGTTGRNETGSDMGNMTMPENPMMGDSEDDGLDLENECPELVEIFHFMNTTGCLDERGAIIGEGPNREVNMTDFCATCDIPAIYDMASAINATACYNDSKIAEGLRMIIPVYAAMCVQDANDTYCAAPFLLRLFADDENDDDTESLMLQACEETCLFFDEMLAFSYDCFLWLPMFASMCVQDAGRMCVDELGYPVESASFEGYPMMEAERKFCDDPCGGAVLEFWEAEALDLPECRSDLLAQMVDPTTMCIVDEDGSFCASEVLPALTYNVSSCDFTGNPTDWTCEGECLAAAEDIVMQTGCCAEVYFGELLGDDLVDAVDTWLTNTCSLAVDSICSVNYIEPSDRPECAAIRHAGYSMMDAIRCMVEMHEGHGNATAPGPAPEVLP